jgi:hypothetical protein
MSICLIAKVKIIINSSYLQNLTYLDLRYNNIGNRGVKIIVNSSYLQNITLI